MTAVEKPGFAVPPLACDCHMHVFGPPDRYPGAPGRTYTPSAKPLDEYRRVSGQLGLQRVVLVQPSAYGADNRALLDTLGAG
ncbi:MAG: amidohydrolase family protein, partial [Acetobacteraceae bacterium]